MDQFELILVGENEAFLRMFSFLIKSIPRNISLVQYRVEADVDINFLSEENKEIFLAEDSLPVRDILVRHKLFETHKIIVVSNKPDLGTLKYYLSAGTAGLSSLETAVRDVEYILKSVVFKNVYICPHYTSILFSFLRLSEPDMSISEREKQVLHLLHRGFTYVEISRDLRLSRETVKKHVSNLYHKLGVSGKGQAINKALKMGILN